MGLIFRILLLMLRLVVILALNILVAILPVVITVLSWCFYAAVTAVTATALGLQQSVERLRDSWRKKLHQTFPYQYSDHVDKVTSAGAWALIAFGWVVIAVFLVFTVRLVF